MNCCTANAHGRSDAYGRSLRFVWQIFDAKVKNPPRDEYHIKQVTRVTANNTLEELVKKLDDVNAKAALKEIEAYNVAVRTDIPLNPAISRIAGRHFFGSSNGKGVNMGQAKIIGIALVVIGLGLAFWGYQQSGSLGSQVSQAFTGSAGNKVMTLYIGGAVSFVVGLYLLMKK